MSANIESFCCIDHRMIIQEMKREHGLLIDLKNHIIPILRFNNVQADHIVHAFDDILCCSNGIISKIQAEVCDGGNSDPGIDKGNGRNNALDNMKVFIEDGTVTKKKRRKNAQHTGSVVTATPDYDGYEWRKYGQKSISKTKHSRSYYRCTNQKGQGCMATKTVQQIENGNSSNSVVKLYNVDYFCKHTCKVSNEMVCPDIVETDSPKYSSINDKYASTRLTNHSDDHQPNNEMKPENFFAVPDMSLFSENMWDIMFEDVTMNSTFSLEQEAKDSWIKHQQDSTIHLWADELC
uniref:WRKY domain-containing protein n=1 Tax=Oryza nivara TaxID=4536 RepID=A0A0E0IH76_ORYNI